MAFQFHQQGFVAAAAGAMMTMRMIGPTLSNLIQPARDYPALVANSYDFIFIAQCAKKSDKQK